MVIGKGAPGLAQTYLSEIGKVLPQLCLRRLTICGLPPATFSKTIMKDFTIERLVKNYFMEEMNFSLTVIPHPFFRRSRLSDLPIKHNFFLNLNQFHRRYGTSRKDFVTNPESVPGQKWLDLFTALAKEEGDGVSAIYYYGHMALDWFSSQVRPNTDDLAKTNKLNKLEVSKKKPKLGHGTATTAQQQQQQQPENFSLW